MDITIEYFRNSYRVFINGKQFEHGNYSICQKTVKQIENGEIKIPEYFKSR